MIVALINTIIFLLVIPFCLGLPIVKKMEGSEQSLPFVFVSGMLCYLAVFQVCYVPLVLYYNHFTTLVYTVVVVVALLSVLCFIRQRSLVKTVLSRKFKWNGKIIIPWIAAIAIIGFQLYHTIFYQFIDGDDAYYGSFSVIMEQWEVMYVHIPYTGITSILDIRHAFSGAPVFVSFLARILQVHPIIVYHIILPTIIVIMMFVIYGMIGSILFRKNLENVPVFLGMVGLLYIYGNTSIYTTATFALTRTAQGKAIIGNLVIPIVFYLILRISEKCRNEQSCKTEFLLLSFATLMGGFSTMLGLVLVPILSGLGLFILAILYKNWKILGLQLLALIPACALGVLYMIAVY